MCPRGEQSKYHEHLAIMHPEILFDLKTLVDVGLEHFG